MGYEYRMCSMGMWTGDTLRDVPDDPASVRILGYRSRQGFYKIVKAGRGFMSLWVRDTIEILAGDVRVARLSVRNGRVSGRFLAPCALTRAEAIKWKEKEKDAAFEPDSLADICGQGNAFTHLNQTLWTWDEKELYQLGIHTA